VEKEGEFIFAAPRGLFNFMFPENRMNFGEKVGEMFGAQTTCWS